MYEALRAYFVQDLPSFEAARLFGYTANSFRVLCHQFRRDHEPEFFAATKKGPHSQPKKSAARNLIIDLRKRNHSVYEISEILKDQNRSLSPTAVREVLKAEGFAPLPRRLDEERPKRLQPTIEPIADARKFSLAPRSFTTRCGGLFLFLPDLARLEVDRLAKAARLPGSKMIPATHALRASLALKLWSVEHKSHVMALAADEGLALFSGLPATPKKSYFSEYPDRTTRSTTTRLLAAWHDQLSGDNLFSGKSFNVDFHSVSYGGKDSIIQDHYVSMRSRRQPSVLVFLAHDADSRAFCYSNADLRKGEESKEILRFVAFWKKTHHELPRHLVFDSKLTTQDNLVRLDRMGITFITLRRRSPKLLQQFLQIPASAWRVIDLDIPGRKFNTPRVYEQSAVVAGGTFRQLFIKDLGHDKPTILLTNDPSSHKHLITRYAQRMLIENALSDAVRFFHMNALSSAVGLKVDFDMALLVIASGLYRLLAKRMRGYADAQARKIFRDLLNMPATVTITEKEVNVEFHRRAHLPILLASDLFRKRVPIPWWNNLPLRLSTYMQPPSS
jgi:hypothetical protein